MHVFVLPAAAHESAMAQILFHTVPMSHLKAQHVHLPQVQVSSHPPEAAAPATAASAAEWGCINLH
jgi:hypothetical protein